MLNNCRTIEELKKEYRRLAFKCHPDHGGSTAQMQQLNAEYDEMLKRLINAENKDSDEVKFAEGFKEVIDQLINCEGLKIEICGSWLWVSGNTKAYKDTLKELGFAWRSKKMMWSLGNTSKKKHSEWDMDKIRATFGSEKIMSQGRPALA